MQILLAVFYVLFPLVIMHMCDRFSFLKKIGSVILAYFTGIVLGSSGILEYGDFTKVQDLIINISVSVAIPLMLFSTDLRSVVKLASKTLLSLVIALFAVITAVVTGYLLFGSSGSKEMAETGGLLVGVYTGGTPNLAALQLALGIKPELYLAVHSYDIVISTVYLFILMTFGKKIFGLILPEYVSTQKEDVEGVPEKDEPMKGLFSRKRSISLLRVLGLSVLIFALSAIVMLTVDETYQMAVFIMVLTTLSLLASFNSTIRNTEKTFDLGMYFILIFSIVIASKIDTASFSELNTNIFLYVSYVVLAGLLLHVLISSLFRVDADTVIITSTALVCSPPFVPVVAGAIGNREIVLPGITVGLIGYAVGNYLGLLTAMLLSAI